MIERVRGLMELIKLGLLALRDTDFTKVQYLSLGLALGAGLFITLLLVIKLLWGRNKSKRPYSGHNILKEDQRGRGATLLYLIPKILLTVSMLLMLWALANPFLPKTKIEEITESRERIDLIDVSSSKSWEFKNTGKSAGEIGREAFLKFLDMRKGQNDRVSLQAFAGEYYIIEDFIIDDDVYLMQAEDAPYVFMHSGHNSLPENDESNFYEDSIAPRDRIAMVSDSGATDLNGALEGVIRYFDNNSDKRLRHKALLIETDAAVEDDPDKYFKELKKRGVFVYFLQIEPNIKAEKQYDVNAMDGYEILKKRVNKYGWRFYNVSDPRSLERAYRDIDKLEKSPVKIVRHLLRITIYQRPLLASVVLLLVAIGLGLVLERFLGEYP